MIAVILAGGSGTRFWPLSRESHPKQFLKIADSKTLIQRTVERLLPLIPIDNCFVVTNEKHALQTCQQLSEFKFNPSNLITEPVGRNTAPAIALATAFLKGKGLENEIMAVFSADHAIKNPQELRNALILGESIAGKGYLTTLGIKPSRPDTGYGYICQGEWINQEKTACKVQKFVEKPDLNTAQNFLKENIYLWNCGIFLWKVSTIQEELKINTPDIYSKLLSGPSDLSKNSGKYSWNNLTSEGRDNFSKITPVSIDYGVMEKSNNVAVIPVNLDWNDLGSWNALENIEKKDKDNNIFTENVFSKNCKGSIIHGENRIIAAIGLEDIVVADTRDALLICKKSQTQDVKNMVAEIKKAGREEIRSHAQVLKPWGSYTNLESGKGYLIKKIEVAPGEKLSQQSHKHRDEHWVVVSGHAEIQMDETTSFLKENESTFIPKGSKHRLGNPGKTDLILIETQIGDILDEEDIIRYQDIYGRA
ncbi:MAG: mannose-1-phosphate guanylyltransferase/mannose-6-phosphate isomerase [Nitrospinales bacterium]